MAKVNDRPSPMRVVDPDSGETYVLEFDRASVRFAEQRGFRILNVQDSPETSISDLFFYAFRKNHKNLAREKVDKILGDLEGLLPDEVQRLQELYAASITSLNVEGERKNSRMKVEL